MSDTVILYAGVLCFSLIFAAFVFTVREFRKMSRAEARSASRKRTPDEATQRPLQRGGAHAGITR